MKFERLIPLALFTLGLAATLVSCESSDTDEAKIIDPLDYDYTMVASGQTALYDHDGAVLSSLSIGDDFYGQDASYLKGQTMTYTDNGDSTVTDNNTELMWQQVPISDKLSWEDAKEYCENLVFAGYDDWRLPNIKELFSLNDFGKGWPYIDTEYFFLASGEVDKSEQFWSSNIYVGTTVEGGENSAFGVNHVTGHIKTYAMGGDDMPSDMDDDGAPSDGGPEGTDNGNPEEISDSTSVLPPSDGEMPGGDNTGTMESPLFKHVRAVRGNTYGENQLVDNEDGTITDEATGLMWSQDDDGEGLDWENALAYAEAATLSGYDDWRLPNVKELQAIIDYSYSPSAYDEANLGAAIDPMFNCTAIVNEAGNDDYGYYWTGTSANFTSDQPYYYAWYVAFGRAVNGEGLDYHGAGGVRFDTKYEGGPLGEGGERYYNFVRLVRDVE